MDLKPLESARTKLAQASLRVNELQSELSVGMNTTYGFSFIHASDTDELIIRAMIPRDVFIHFSVAAGEVFITLDPRSTTPFGTWFPNRLTT